MKEKYIYIYTINLSIKGTQGNLKMCPYIQVKIICTIYSWGK